MKPIVHKLILLIWPCILGLLLASCGQKMSHPSSLYPTPSDGNMTLQGTVDGGGGAGFKGRPLEEFHRKIENLSLFPEYRYVESILKSIEQINPSHAKIFRSIVRNRLWLFLDEPIPKISDFRQGVPFNVDQWAVQNSK